VKKYNKKGGLTDLFLFMILGFILLVVSGIFLFIGHTMKEKLLESGVIEKTLEGTGENATQVIEMTMGKVVESYELLKWLTTVLIVGLMLSIFVTSYLVKVRPIFFVPYILLVIISIIVSVPLSNTYETLINHPTLASTFSGFVGGNFIWLNLPIWITVIGFGAGLIMFINVARSGREGY